MYTKKTFCNFVFSDDYDGILHQVNMNSRKYKEIAIPKKGKNGGTRKILTIPSDNKLFELQKRLCEVLLNGIPLPVAARGFVRGESYRTYLENHVNSSFFLRMDISDFFGSISKDSVLEVFNEIVLIRNERDKVDIVDLLWKMVSFEEKIPQGVSTSPAISNLVFRRLDQRITKYCQLFDIEYTRYADDLLFSSKLFNFKEKKWFYKKIKYILGSCGFSINFLKTKYSLDRISLNGFVIENGQIRLSRKRLSDIRKLIKLTESYPYGIVKGNEEDFLKTLNSQNLLFKIDSFTSVSCYLSYLKGYRSFLISWAEQGLTFTPPQKDLARLILRLEKQIKRITNCYYLNNL